MANFIIGFLNLLIKALGGILSIIFKILPPSPFSLLDNSVIKPYLGTINYFVPFSEAILILEVWTVSIGIFYLYQIVLRWIKAIE